MKNRTEDGSVKRPVPCDELRCPKLPRLDSEDSLDTHGTALLDLPDAASYESQSPVDLSGEASLGLPDAPTAATGTSTTTAAAAVTSASGLAPPVLKIPSTMKCLTTFDLPGKADLHQLLTNNLAQHLAVQNERLKSNLLFGHNHTGLLRPPPPAPPGPPCPLRDPAPLAREPQDAAASRDATRPAEDEAAREQERKTTKDVEDKHAEEAHDEGEGGAPHRVTPFSVLDILDPHKFTGRTAEDDMGDSSSDRQDEDDAYISGEPLHSSPLHSSPLHSNPLPSPSLLQVLSPKCLLSVRQPSISKLQLSTASSFYVTTALCRNYVNIISNKHNSHAEERTDFMTEHFSYD